MVGSRAFPKRQRAGAVQDAGATNDTLIGTTILLLTEHGFFGVGEFRVAAMVAAIVDEFLGGGQIVLGRFPRVRFRAEEEAGLPAGCPGQAGAVEVDVGQVQPLMAALGNLPGFVGSLREVPQGTTDNSPPIHRWIERTEREGVPSGTKEIVTGENGFCRP